MVRAFGPRWQVEYRWARYRYSLLSSLVSAPSLAWDGCVVQPDSLCASLDACASSFSLISLISRFDCSLSLFYSRWTFASGYCYLFSISMFSNANARSLVRRRSTVRSLVHRTRTAAATSYPLRVSVPACLDGFSRMYFFRWKHLDRATRSVPSLPNPYVLVFRRDTILGG